MSLTRLKAMTAVAATVFLSVGGVTTAAADQCTAPVAATGALAGGTVQTCVDRASMDLLAGQTIPAGTLDVTLTDPGTLTFTFTAANTFALTGTHFWIGTSTEAIPTNRAGNPVPGQLPYKSGPLNNAASYTLPALSLGTVPFEFACPTDPAAYPLGGGAQLVFSPYVVAAHAAMSSATYGGQTAWSEGARLTDKGNWMTYSTLGLYCIYTPPGPDVYVEDVTYHLRQETAFAYDPTGRANAFCGDSTLKADRWGWTNGPYAAGETVLLDLWAGAGQCDRSKGTLVGTVEFTYYGDGTARAKYTTTGGWTLDETHFYAGPDKYKCTTTTSTTTNRKTGVTTTTSTTDCTVAPGQYPAQHNTLGQVEADELGVVGLSGDVYAIAHAAVVIQEPDTPASK